MTLRPRLPSVLARLARVAARGTVAWLLDPASLARACAVCVGSSEGQGRDAGFYWSALLLTLLPFAVVAVIGVWMRRAPRRPR